MENYAPALSKTKPSYTKKTTRFLSEYDNNSRICYSVVSHFLQILIFYRLDLEQDRRAKNMKKYEIGYKKDCMPRELTRSI